MQARSLGILMVFSSYSHGVLFVFFPCLSAPARHPPTLSFCFLPSEFCLSYRRGGSKVSVSVAHDRGGQTGTIRATPGFWRPRLTCPGRAPGHVPLAPRQWLRGIARPPHMPLRAL